MSMCRFCKGDEDTGSKYALFHYSTRHYAHADCGLKAKGSAFFDLLHDWQLQQFPYFAAKDCGLADVLEDKIRSRNERRTSCR